MHGSLARAGKVKSHINLIIIQNKNAFLLSPRCENKHQKLQKLRELIKNQKAEPIKD